jgi:hypothetical protein
MVTIQYLTQSQQSAVVKALKVVLEQQAVLAVAAEMEIMLAALQRRQTQVAQLVSETLAAQVLLIQSFNLAVAVVQARPVKQAMVLLLILNLVTAEQEKILGHQ